MKNVVLLTVCLALAACQQSDPVVTQDASVGQQKSKSAEPKSSSAVAAPARPTVEVSSPARNLSLNPPKIDQKNSFADISSCTKSGYALDQCSQAYGVAYAMHMVDAPVYDTSSLCEKSFASCIVNDKKKYIPKMEAFTVAGQAKGAMTKPSSSSPIYFVPLYKNASGALGPLSVVGSPKPQ